jgi:hypothetical protein
LRTFSLKSIVSSRRRLISPTWIEPCHIFDTSPAGK